MKRLFLSAALVILAVSGFAQGNQACYKDTSLVDELYVRKDTLWAVRQDFQKGDWNLYWDFALTKIKAEAHYSDNGKKVGTWKEYYKNGQQASEWNYDGAVVQFYPPGKEWYWNGKLKTDRTQTADSVFETTYFNGGKISGRNTWDKMGKWILHEELCESGQVILHYNPTSETVLPVKKYYCSGILRSEYNWYAYGYVGKYKEYHANGKVSVDGQYTEKPADQAVYMARKTGVWTYYDDKGKVTKKETWENGRLVSTDK